MARTEIPEGVRSVKINLPDQGRYDVEIGGFKFIEKDNEAKGRIDQSYVVDWTIAKEYQKQSDGVSAIGYKYTDWLRFGRDDMKDGGKFCNERIARFLAAAGINVNEVDDIDSELIEGKILQVRLSHRADQNDKPILNVEEYKAI